MIPEKIPAAAATEVSGTTAEPSGDHFAAELRGFGPIGILAILVIAAGNFVVLPLSSPDLQIAGWRQ